MTPYYQDPSFTLYCGEAFAALARLEAGAADVVVMDPPFGVDFDRGDWPDKPADYPEFMRRLLGATQRVVPPGDGAHAVWQSATNLSRMHEWLPEQWRVFASCKGFVQMRPTPINWAWDPVVIWGALPPYEKPAKGQVRRDWFLASQPIWQVDGKVAHPCPRGVAVTTEVVRLVSRVGQTILDPFLGSGTTALAALAQGRRCIGIEQNEEYCRLAIERLQARHAQAAMRLTGEGQGEE